MNQHKTESPKPQNEFVPPRHWIGPEELEASYWNDPATKEKRGQEFFEKPVEWLDKIEKTAEGSLARRDFLTIMGASMAMAGFACARRPVHKIIPYVVKPEQIAPGNPLWYASTYRDGHVSYGVLVKTREGRPIKLEGNPEHPLSKGALDSRAQAAILDLYDPDRLKTPVARKRGAPAGTGKELSWEQADAAITAKLKGANRVRVLSDETDSESQLRLIREFVGGFQNGAHVQYNIMALDEVAEGQALSYGSAVLPHYRFDQAEVVVSLSADFLSGWLSPVEYSGAWAKLRKLDSAQAANAKMSKLVVFEPTLTVTGSNADERTPIRPGDELKVALAIAHELIVAQKKSAYAGNEAVTSLLSGYVPAKVAEEIGMTDGAAKFKRLAELLWAARGKSLIVAGGLQARGKDQVALQVAVNLLNSALENEGATVDGSINATVKAAGNLAAVLKLIDEMKAGQVDALVLYRSNLAFTLPKSLGFEEALAKVPFVVAIADREDETAVLADVTLPDNHFLENWGDSTPRKGLYSLQQPTIAPIHMTRSFEDTLIAWVKSGGLKATGLLATAADWHAYLQANWKETVYKQAKAAGTFEQFWEGALRDGVVDVVGAQARAAKPAARSFQVSSLSGLPKYASAKIDGLVLAIYDSAMYDGRGANNAWLQELPDPISSVTWDNYLNIAPATAKIFNLKQNDVVELKTPTGTVELPVYVQPGLHAAVLSVKAGYGRRSVGKVGNLAGVDVFPLVAFENKKLVFSGHSVSIRKTERIYRLATTQWHTASENRPIINDITLTEFKKDPATANHTDPHLRLKEVPTMWPAHEYKGHRWGMVIDMNACTGCSACMIACQAENNVPVVGRDQVRVARNMHWLRIDRYYAGTPENPDVVFQPMLCQHCENAPCETVCPVLATVHDDEGLNVQVYNRCVGTRYCQNNCPYKVRRFNFFDHWKSYESTMNLAWNPDVTVRTRGIMEKCTFCVQRIRDAKDKAKDLGGKVKDGDLKTACQQTCPTGAITFGDINAQDSAVSKLRNDARAFRALEVLNVKPVISYLSKVRNVEGKVPSHGKEGEVTNHGHH